MLKVISLQWEGKDVYNFSISNCVVSLDAAPCNQTTQLEIEKLHSVTIFSHFIIGAM